VADFKGFFRQQIFKEL